MVTLYPTAAEGTASLGPEPQPDAPPIPLPLTPSRPERSEGVPRDGRTDHDRRAAGRLRRYAVANGCTRLMTLTYASQHTDLRRIITDCHEFQRRLARAYPGVAWARAFERHKSGALHVHYVVSKRLDHAAVTRIWPHGFVWLSPKTRTKRGGREDARHAARYVSKYVVKDPVRLPGGHRYEVRQGGQPERVRVWVTAQSARAGLEMAADSLGVSLGYVWESSTLADWLGPPTAFGSW